MKTNYSCGFASDFHIFPTIDTVYVSQSNYPSIEIISVRPNFGKDTPKEDDFLVAIFTVKPKTFRNKALSWWSKQSESDKLIYCLESLPGFVNPSFVTGLQIEIMYEKATGEKEEMK